MNKETLWKKSHSNDMWNLEKYGVKATIHKYVGMGKIFHLSCYELNIQRKQLGEIDDIEEAKKAANRLLIEALTHASQRFKNLALKIKGNS